jgi:DivIVA domain-containing protein
VASDRQRIEKRDFPTVRQGYDKAAVDAHLAAIAEELEHLTLASSASDRVRAIVEAAETTAAQIQRDADDAARATRQEAEQAARHAREGAGKLSELASALTQHLDESRRQLEALTGSLPAAADAATAPEPAARTGARVYTQPGDPEPGASAHAAGVHAPETSAPVPAERPPTQVAPAAGADASESARLIALNMALNGSSREETAKYLEDNFRLVDRDRLLDEVYASVQG